MHLTVMQHDTSGERGGTTRLMGKGGVSLLSDTDLAMLLSWAAEAVAAVNATPVAVYDVTRSASEVDEGQPFVVGLVVGSCSRPSVRVLLAATSYYPCYDHLSDTLRRTYDVLKAADAAEWTADAAVRIWTQQLEAINVPAALRTPCGGKWPERICLDSQLPPHEVAAVPVRTVHSIFSFSALRVLQSALLCGDYIVVCGPLAQAVSAVCVTLPALVAPFACCHDVHGYCTAPTALRYLSDSAASHIVGVHPSAVAQIIMSRFATVSTNAQSVVWIADCRTGQVARCPSPSEPPKSLVLLPVLDKFKDAYRKANATPAELSAALIDSMVTLLGAYRKGIETSAGVPARISLHRALQVSDNVGFVPFAERAQTYSAWAMFERRIIDVERRRDLIVTALRGTASSALSQDALSGASLCFRSVLAFVVRCARKTPEAYTAEFVAAGKPPKEATAGKFFKDILGKAKEAVVTQFSSSYDVEVGARAAPFCQCEAVFQAAPVSASSSALSARLLSTALHRKPSLAPPPSSVLPADLVHHFDEYHCLVTPSGGLQASQAAASDPSSGEATAVIVPAAVEVHAPTAAETSQQPRKDALDALFGDAAPAAPLSTPVVVATQWDMDTLFSQ